MQEILKFRDAAQRYASAAAPYVRMIGAHRAGLTHAAVVAPEQDRVIAGRAKVEPATLHCASADLAAGKPSGVRAPIVT